MSKQLNNMATSSRMKRDDNVLRVFAYLNTRGEFNPVLLPKKVPVSLKTLLSYLRQIQEAQFLTKGYLERFSSPKFKDNFPAGNPAEVSHLEVELANWSRSRKRASGFNSEQKDRSLQFIFTESKFGATLEERYLRLERSLLFVSMLVRNQPKK